MVEILRKLGDHIADREVATKHERMPIALLFCQYLSSTLGIVVSTLNVSAAFDELSEKILACILAGLRF